MQKRIIVIFLAIIFSLAISMTNRGDAHSSGSRQKWIALIVEYSASDYIQRYIEGVKQEAKRLGFRLEVLDAKGNKLAMPRMVDDVTLRSVDGILISHGKAAMLSPSIKRTVGKKIPIVAIHNDLDLLGVSLLSQDDRRIAEVLMNEFIKDTGGNANFVLIWIGGFEPMDLRMESYKKIMAEQPGLHEIHRFGSAGAGTALHTEVTLGKLLKEDEEHSINAVVAMWDEYAKGATEAIMKEKRNDIRLYGIDISDNVLQLMQTPHSPWVATVAVDSRILGKIQVQMLARAIAGEKLQNQYTVAPVLIRQSTLTTGREKVTMDNLHHFVAEIDNTAIYLPE